MNNLLSPCCCKYNSSVSNEYCPEMPASKIKTQNSNEIINKFATNVLSKKRSIKNNKIVYLHPTTMHKKKTMPDEIIPSDAKQEDIKHPKLISNHKSKKLSPNSEKNGKRGSKFRGVSKNGHQWQVLIMVNKKKRYVGSYSNEEEAARYYDKVSLQHHGNKAKTNFYYTSEEIKEIQKEPLILKIKLDL